jgi:adenosylhomocysteine nucleosidase
MPTRWAAPRITNSTQRTISHTRQSLVSSHYGHYFIHVGIIASGDEDVIELERAAALRQATEACAVAWEGAGGARACRFNEMPFLELRAITDTADHNAPGDFATNLHIAMASAAALVNLWRAR